MFSLGKLKTYFKNYQAIFSKYNGKKINSQGIEESLNFIFENYLNETEENSKKEEESLNKTKKSLNKKILNLIFKKKLNNKEESSNEIKESSNKIEETSNETKKIKILNLQEKVEDFFKEELSFLRQNFKYT